MILTFLSLAKTKYQENLNSGFRLSWYLHVTLTAHK